MAAAISQAGRLGGKARERGRKTGERAFGKIDRLGRRTGGAERISDGSRDRLQTAYTDRWDYLISNLARDGSTAYNCHRRANERVARSNAPAREKMPFFFYL